MEIEKKFLVSYLPDNYMEFPKKVIEQGYLCTEPVVRIRKSNEDYILTYKSKEGLEQSQINAKVCHEVEVPLTKKSYLHLKKKIDGNLVQKIRYLLPLSSGVTAELDLFEGTLKGLLLVEVEFKKEEEAAFFSAPDWFGEEVSNDERYTNRFLAMLQSLKELEKNAAK